MPPALPLSVLIVEDNHDGAETLAALLDIYGHTIRVAHAGAEALRLAGESAPDAVILDIGLPGMDGFDLARALIEMLPSRPLLVAVSGYTNMRERCWAAGIDHYYIKPVEPSVLGALLRAHAVTLAVPE